MSKPVRASSIRKPAVPRGTASPGAQSPKVEQILAAAGAIFMAQGYGDASMDAIAAKANISKATLYAHFSGKEALFAAVIRERCEKLDWTATAEKLWQAPPAEALRRIGQDFCALILSPGSAAMHRVVVSEASRFPQLGRVFYESGPAQIRRSLANYLEQADREGGLALPDATLAAGQFLGMLIGHFHLPRLLGLIERPPQAEIDRVVDGAVALFLRGYGASVSDRSGGG
jgi:AcrR family transcriptional regulator